MITTHELMINGRPIKVSLNIPLNKFTKLEKAELIEKVKKVLESPRDYGTMAVNGKSCTIKVYRNMEEN